jgi:hypothetical protein
MHRGSHVAFVVLSLCFSQASGCDDSSTGPDSKTPFTLERQDTNVSVSEAYRPCVADIDCTLVNVTCNGCCERDAISSALVTTYKENRDAACFDYRGGVCDCDFLPMTARCEAQRCVARDP